MIKKEKTKEEQNKMNKKEQGITLIALVVTIVVLLILAGVSISLVLGDNGIINKSKDARDKYAQAEANDQAAISEAGDWIDEQVGGDGTGGGITIGKVVVNEKADTNSTINGQAPSASNPIIPEGYIPIDTDTTSWGDGTTAPTQNDVDHGLVIKDESGNEWVWIPVPEVSVMCDAVNETESTLCGTSGDDAVKTKLYSKSGIISGITRTTPGTTSHYREPDLVVENGSQYDAAGANRDTAGFTKTENGTTRTMTVKEMAEAMVKNYEDMIASIGKYKGFYVGRYELSNAGEKRNQPTLTKTNWYALYKKCTDLKPTGNDKVKTEMIWGSQWDVICNWIATKGDQKSITNSSNWGNHSDYNTANNYTEENEKYEAGAGSKQNTGSSENWKANNLYDIAGNCYEWTQEANNTSYRVDRGGGSSSNGNGSDYPVSDRGNSLPDYSNGSSIGSRSTLIVK